MATILDFPPPGAGTATARAPRRPGPGEIVIFPGVRYERKPEAEAAPRERQGEVSRDRLTLVD